MIRCAEARSRESSSERMARSASVNSVSWERGTGVVGRTTLAAEFRRMVCVDLGRRVESSALEPAWVGLATAEVVRSRIG